jgi:hypothetical protein
MIQAPGVNLINLFWNKFTHSLVKARSFQTSEKKLFSIRNWPSLHKGEVDLFHKKLFEIVCCSQYYKYFIE